MGFALLAGSQRHFLIADAFDPVDAQADSRGWMFPVDNEVSCSYCGLAEASSSDENTSVKHNVVGGHYPYFVTLMERRPRRVQNKWRNREAPNRLSESYIYRCPIRDDYGSRRIARLMILTRLLSTERMAKGKCLQNKRETNQRFASLAGGPPGSMGWFIHLPDNLSGIAINLNQYTTGL